MITAPSLTIAEYIAGLRFRFLQPSDPTNRVDWSTDVVGLIDQELENIELVCENVAMKNRLRPLGTIPRMGTLANAAIINYGVSQLPYDQCYLNVGTWNGFSFFAGMVENPDKRCIGVDNFTQTGRGNPKGPFLDRFNALKSPQHQFVESDYAVYLKTQHTAPIGFYFYDGPHEYAHQLQGLKLAEPFFADGCIVMVDDTNWDAPRQATLDFVEASAYSYRTLLDQKVYDDGGHPTFWNGITILQKES